MTEIVPIERITDKICLIPSQKVIIDHDLAELYGVETKQLKRDVGRNQHRFPSDFMFELTREEYSALRSQFGTIERGTHSKYLPMAFMEQGVAMLSSVLNSDRAIEVNITIMRAFVQLRGISSSQALKRKAGRKAERSCRTCTKQLDHNSYALSAPTSPLTSSVAIGMLTLCRPNFLISLNRFSNNSALLP